MGGTSCVRCHFTLFEQTEKSAPNILHRQIELLQLISFFSIYQCHSNPYGMSEHFFRTYFIRNFRCIYSLRYWSVHDYEYEYIYISLCLITIRGIAIYVWHKQRSDRMGWKKIFTGPVRKCVWFMITGYICVSQIHHIYVCMY